MTKIEVFYMVAARSPKGFYYIRHRHNIRKMWGGNSWVDHVCGAPKGCLSPFRFESREDVEEYIRYAKKVA
jgi:hypothetical protein